MILDRVFSFQAKLCHHKSSYKSPAHKSFVANRIILAVAPLSLRGDGLNLGVALIKSRNRRRISAGREISHASLPKTRLLNRSLDVSC